VFELFYRLTISSSPSTILGKDEVVCSGANNWLIYGDLLRASISKESKASSLNV